MPGMDGTGPMGMGPMTGGGRGWCNPYYAGMRPLTRGYPYFAPLGWGGRFPLRTFRGYGPAAGYPPPAWDYYVPGPSASGGWGPYGAPYSSPAEETRFLKNQAEMIRKDLEEIEARIQELDAKK